jgi:Carboxypeptidase regulatory-like domain/TonB dependent receptor
MARRRQFQTQIAKLVLLMVGVLLVGGVAIAQQTTGDILGTVTDSSGAVVGNATVTIESLDTHETRTAKTADNGDYVVNLLKPGNYSITVNSSGFKSFMVPSLTLFATDRVRINAQLTLGQATESVTVLAESSALQTDSSVLNSTINYKAVQDLPLNGRNFVQLVQLSPGVNEGPQNGGLTSGGALDDRRVTSSISANGQSDILNNQMLDGVDNNERLIGAIGVRPAVDGIREVSVQTSNYTSESGRTAGAVVNIITKSGTNQFHGTVFEYFRNDKLDTYPFAFGTALPKAELRLNQFGGSLGGPIVKDKTFFFADYEGYRQVRAGNPSRSTVPTLLEEQNPGNFSDLCPDNGGNLGPPCLFGPIGPGDQLDSAGLNYFSLYPAPNLGSNQWVGEGKTWQSSNVFDVRVDHQFRPTDSLFARFSFNKVNTIDPGPLPSKVVAGLNLNPNFSTIAPDLAYNGLLNYVHTFNSNLLMELKASYTRVDNEAANANTGLNPNEAFGQPNVNSPTSEATALALAIVVTGTALGGGGVFNPVKDKDNTFEYNGSVTYTHGAHNLRLGGRLVRRQLTSFQSSFSEGLWLFFDYPSLVAGKYFSVTRSLSLVPPHFRVWEPAVYAQDDWHIAKKLTLNLGLRYEIFTPLSEVNGRISTFDPATGQMLVPGQNGVGNTAGVKTDHHGLAPRVGFAYSAGRGLVVRGGFGLSYFPMNTTSNANMKNQPFIANFGPCGVTAPGPYGLVPQINTCPEGFSGFINGLPPSVAASANPIAGTIPDGVDPHLRTSYVEHYNLSVQKDFAGNVLTVNYVGVLGRQIAQVLPDLNQPPPNTCFQPDCDVNTLRPYFGVQPNMSTIGWFQSHGKSTYQGLQASFDRRLKNGLTLNANYQYAHALDNVDGLSNENGQGIGSVPSRVGTLDYGNSDLDVRHRIVGTANYELPFGRSSHGFAGALIKGWQVNVINVWSTGQAFTVLNATNRSGTTVGTGNPGAGSDRPDQVGSATLSNPSLSEFFNTAAFVPQTLGTIGSERKNQLHGPHFRHLDASLFKAFPLTERYKLEFRAECFNVTNTTNFALPNVNLPDNNVAQSNFGRIDLINQWTHPREIQFALKLQF